MPKRKKGRLTTKKESRTKRKTTVADFSTDNRPSSSSTAISVLQKFLPVATPHIQVKSDPLTTRNPKMPNPTPPVKTRSKRPRLDNNHVNVVSVDTAKVAMEEPLAAVAVDKVTKKRGYCGVTLINPPAGSTSDAHYLNWFPEDPADPNAKYCKSVGTNVSDESSIEDFEYIDEEDEENNREDLADLRTKTVQQIEEARGRPNQLNTYLMAAHYVDIEAHDLGDFNCVCHHCGAKHFAAEANTVGKYNRCCFDGKVILPPLQPLPQQLEALYTNSHPLSKAFLKDILKYNNAFQFASVEAELRQKPTGRGPMIYSIQGKMYHHVGDVVVPNREAAKYGAVYFLETEEAIGRRYSLHQRLNEVLLRILETILRQTNPFAQGYEFLRKRYEQQQREGVEAPSVFLQILQSRNLKRRELDMPVVNEVAAVYTANETNPPCPRLAVYTIGEQRALKTIQFFDASSDPLTFPLLFPSGELGWEFGIPRNNTQGTITLCQYYANRMAYRQGFQVIHYSGKLAEQYAVAAYIKIEANNIQYILKNQNKLRADEYVGLADYLHNRAAEDNVPLGKMVILPSSFSGSPRSQMQRFQDAMAVVGRLGKPSLFITMTCNPKWPEILQNIPEGYTPNNHPMLIDRVFQAKLLQLIDDVWKRHIFGVPLAYLYVIEFQKRGLPHAHILLTLREEDRLIDNYRIDQLISAEIPDRVADQELYELVKTHMIHGPCGEYNRGAPCMDENKCKKYFPKQYSEETVILESGTIMYRRRKSKRAVEFHGKCFNCQWVVPYNPFLLKKYRSHINVEACASLKSVKYLHKYFFKQPDSALIKITEHYRQQDTDNDVRNTVLRQLDYNEVEHYLNTRYMSATEACWHLNQFCTHKMSHSVYRMPVHLPERHRVVFEHGREQDAFERNAATMLTAWFELNRNDPEARCYLYSEIPLHYVWQRKEKQWNKRQRLHSSIITRVFSVNIRQRELYFLRTLLLHVRGATSFEDVRTVNEEVCDTFEEACRKRGLLAEDAEWNRCLAEAAERQMPTQLRQLFAFILCFCDVQDAKGLWIAFKDYLIEDFLHRQLPLAEATYRALIQIQSVLIVNGCRLSDFNIDEPIVQRTVFDCESDDEDDIQLEAMDGNETPFQLNVDQQAVYDTIINAVRNDDELQRLFYLKGAGGTGKTYLYNAILRTLQLQCVALAWTGIAANLLFGGRTVHSCFKVPILITESSTSTITPRSKDGEMLRNIKLIIWDEISMSSRIVFDFVDRTMRDVCQNNLPFGGKVVLLGGDFRQCLPIVTSGSRVDIVRASVKQSNLWHLFQKLELHINVRAQEDNTGFADWLLQLGDGTLEGIRRGDDTFVSVPPDCLVNNVDRLISKVFDDLQPYQVPKKAILTPLNSHCNVINNIICDRLPGEEHTYYSADRVVEDDITVVRNYPVEFLNGLTISGVPPHQLKLKEGTIVMMLRNLNVRKGICNGTRCLIRNLGELYIEVELINSNGHLSGKTAFIPRIDFRPVQSNLPFELSRRQYPLRIAYAVTINKSQGQTYDAVGIYLERPIFSHGQLYVAFSRAKSRNSVFVFVQPTPSQGRMISNSSVVYTKNVVYREALA